MLTWYSPGIGEVNFLPWQEQQLKNCRRMRFWCYGSLGVALVFGLAFFAGLHMNLLQVKAEMAAQIFASTQQLAERRQRLWAASRESRQLRWNQSLRVLQSYHAWLPLHELAQLLALLKTSQKLVSWQWRPTDSGQKVVFKLTGSGAWQSWWQAAAHALPTLHLDALTVTGTGWKLTAHYVASSTRVPTVLTNTLVAPASSPFSLQISPPPLAGGLAPEPMALLTRQISNYGKGVEIVRGQGLHVEVGLADNQWQRLAPIPNAAGWVLQHYSISQKPSGQWFVSMKWLPESESEVLALFSDLPSAETQSRTRKILQHYGGSRHAAADASPKLLDQIITSSDKGKVAHEFQFLGYSQQRDQAPVGWIKSVSSGLRRAQVGHLIDGWLVLFVGPKDVHLKRGKQILVLKRQCLTGVCRND